MSYLNRLKLAVINEDMVELEKLSKETPYYGRIEEAKEILSYINEAQKILNRKKKELGLEMNKIKKLKNFQVNSEETSINFKI